MAEEASHHLQLGHAARTAGRASEALGHYRRAVELEPGNAEAQSVYGLMLLNLGRTGDAEGPLRRAVEIAPRHPALRMNLAQWLAQAGRLDEALAIVSAVAEEEPQHWWAWARLGDLQLRKGAGAAAAGAFERAVRLRPEDGELVVKLAAAWRAAGHAAEADRVLGEAGAQVRARVASLRGDAAAQARRGNWSALERTAEAWAAAAPRDADAWRTLAMAQWELARYRRAMLSSARALEVGGRDAAALAAHARFCLQALEFDAAGRALAEAEALDAGLPALLTAKAQFLMLAGRHEEAIAYARRAIARNARDVAAYATLTELTGGRLDAGERRRLEELCGDA
ncbi:MAG TPA: tetratricopeptide repeat protein, partial [Steroidobacteraceae bacterium]|nr:tetratricopeptide repeat protein [Steroidobacteraceae bacterium]